MPTRVGSALDFCLHMRNSYGDVRIEARARALVSP